MNPAARAAQGSELRQEGLAEQSEPEPAAHTELRTAPARTVTLAPDGGLGF